MLGLEEGAAEPEDSYWALQRMLELLDAVRPLVLVVDDLHWAQPPLLEQKGDLVGAARTRGLMSQLPVSRT